MSLGDRNRDRLSLANLRKWICTVHVRYINGQCITRAYHILCSCRHRETHWESLPNCRYLPNSLRITLHRTISYLLRHFVFSVLCAENVNGRECEFSYIFFRDKFINLHNKGFVRASRDDITINSWRWQKIPLESIAFETQLGSPTAAAAVASVAFGCHIKIRTFLPTPTLLNALSCSYLYD